MADMHIEITAHDMMVYAVLSSREVPQSVIDQLTPDDQLEATKYNEEHKYQHWHVKDDNEHDLAFGTEKDADEFLNQLWLYLTAGDEDRNDEVEAETVECHNRACKVYAG